MLKTLASGGRRSRRTDSFSPVLALAVILALALPKWALAQTDTTPPTVTVTSPTANARLSSLTSITGTATDTGSGVNHVNLTLTKTAQDSTTASVYWSDLGWTTSTTTFAATLSAPDADGKVTWSFPSGHSLPFGSDFGISRYQVRPTATDNAGHSATVALLFYSGSDTTPPSLAYSTPAANEILTSLSGPTGTATDANGITRIVATLQRVASNGTNEFWNVDQVTGLGSWSSASQNFFATITHNISPDPDRTDESWAFSGTWPAGTDLPSGIYTWRVFAYDRSENSVNVSRPIGISPNDTTNPTVTLTSPALGTSLTGWTGAVSGGAQDSGSGVSRVAVYLMRGWNGSTEYFNGTTWTTSSSPTYATLGTPDETGALTWSATIPGLSSYTLPSGAYTFRVIATDRYSNSTTITPSYTAGTVDTTNPVTTITTPAASATVDRLPLLSGTATDETGGSGLARVSVQLSHLFSSGGTNTRKYWTGTAWTTTVTNLTTFVMPETPLTTSYNWNVTSGLPAGTDLAAGSNTVKAWCYDRYGNQSTSVTRDFTTIPNTAPSATNQSVDVAFNTPQSFTLVGSDAEGDPITYTVTGSGPAHGTLSGTAPNLTYSPTAGYSGTDSFTFKVNDGLLDSSTATVSITVHELGYIGPASSLTATPQNARVTLSWTAGTGAAYYQVRRAPQAGGPYTTIEEVADGTTYIDTNVSNGHAYFYVVTSAFKDGYNIVHTAADSNEASGIPEPEPMPPLSLIGTPGNNHVQLQWQSGSRADNYEIWRSVGAGTWSKLTTVVAVSGAVNTYVDAGLTNGTFYNYFVRSLNGTTQNVDSNEITVRPALVAPPAPGAPTLSNQHHDSVVVTAPALPFDATSLTLGISTNDGANYQPIFTGLAGNAVTTVDGLIPGIYKFVYTAVGPGGSTQGEEVQTFLLPLPPGPARPYFEQVTSSGYRIVKPSNDFDEWDSLYITGVKLQQQQTGGTWTDVNTVSTYDGDLEIINISGASPDTDYTYRFEASNPQNEWVAGSPATVHTAPGAPPTPLFSGVTSSGFTVRTVATGGTPPVLPAGATSLTLQMSTAGGWKDYASGLTGAAEVSVTGLTPGLEYSFRYVSIGTAGSTPGTSANQTTSTGTFTAPEAPTFSDIGQTDLTLWRRVPAGSGTAPSWSAQVRTETGSYGTAGTGDSSNSLAISGLTAGIKYYFRWVDENGNPGSEASVTTAPATPSAPTVSRGANYSLQVTVPGSASGVVSYTLRAAHEDPDNMRDLVAGVSPGTTVTLDHLTPGDSFVFDVVAVGPDASTEGSPSDWISVDWPAPTGVEAPRILSVGQTSVVVMGPVVLGGYSWTTHLQVRASADTTGPWQPADSEGDVDEIDGLSPNTSYDLRFAKMVGDPIYSSVTTFTTLPALPSAPPAPNILATDTTFVTVEVPALTTGATSLNLQQAIPGGQYHTVVTGASGTSVNVENLVPLSQYYFKWEAVGPGGSTLGPASSTTMQTDTPPAPAAPVFTYLTESSVQVLGPAIPESSFPLILSLQMKQSSQPDTAYGTIAASVASNTLTLVDSLVAGTGYDFRYVLASSAASTPGTAASITTATPVVSWSAGQGIGCAGIRYPITGATFARGQTVRLSSGLATDWDQLSRSINGHEFLKDVTDPCGYLWTCSGGTFVTGGAGGIDNTSSPPRATGSTVLWQAPATAGTYTLKLTVMDQSQGGNIISGQFHNNRSDSEGGSRSDPVRGYPDEPLHFSVTVTIP